MPRARRRLRRASVLVQVTVSATVLLGMTAVAVDLGMLSTARTELQAATDAAALAGANRLLDNSRLKSAVALDTVFAAVRETTSQFAAQNKVFGQGLLVDLNSGNAADGDIVLGHAARLTDRNTPLNLMAPSKYNAVQVTLRKTNTQNGSIALTFAQIFGLTTAELEVRATAGFQDGINGFRVTNPNENAQLMPLSLHRSAWQQLLAGGLTGTNDNYSYDPVTKTVSPGPDGIPELNLYPGSGTGQLPPGNFGTVDIGPSNNSTADISRQIRTGVSAADLAYFGGELKLGPDGTLTLNGDTGLSAAIKDDLESIKGKPRAIPLFAAVAGNGNNANYTVVGFAGIRIMNVRLTGAMKSKQVIIQPGIVVDPTATGDSENDTYFVYRPVTLFR